MQVRIFQIISLFCWRFWKVSDWSLLSGQVHNQVVDCCQYLLSQGADPNTVDNYGETPLISVRHLLLQRRFNEAYAIVCLLTNNLELAVDVNAVDKRQHTLLAYSVGFGDITENVTRHLLNSGADVWQDHTNDKLSDDSAFKFFLKSLMQNNTTIDLSKKTLEMLCTAMSEQHHRMGKHIDRCMIEMGVAPRVNGPLFKRLRTIMAPFMGKPQSLKNLCLTSIRRSVLQNRPLKRLNQAYRKSPKVVLHSNTVAKVSRLNLPQQIQQLICLGEEEPRNSNDA